MKLISVAKVVDSQYRNGKFNRMDMIMRLLCAEEGGKWWKQYRKMQHIRINKIRKIRPNKWPSGYEKRRVKDFLALLESFAEKGYDMSVKGIRLDRDLEIVNGSHRLACCILNGISEIPVQWPPESTKVRRPYALKWFKKHGFSKRVLGGLEARRRKLLKDLGLKDRTTDEYFENNIGWG